MAKRKAARRTAATKSGRKASGARASGRRPTKRTHVSRKSARPKKAGARKQTARTAGLRKAARPATPPPRRRGTRSIAPRLERARRTLEESVPTPPSSLNLNRHGSAVRTGRAELKESLDQHASMTPALTGGDVDADWENAYFSGDEAPGGDNPTPDQDVVEDIGRALGVEYQDNEELKAVEKVTERDKKRWELDPASSEDYKERK